MEKFKVNVTVRYAETDQMGIVYYANYLVWMEVARTKWFEHICGKDYGRLESEDGLYLPVIEASCKYKFAIRYPDEVEIFAAPSIHKRLYLDFSYEIMARGKLCALGYTRHIIMDKEFKPIRPLPEFIEKAIQ